MLIKIIINLLKNIMNELYRIMNVTSDRKTFVLNNNFDDIKNSEYIDKIILDWECASFTNELDGEKKINCSIACLTSSFSLQL